MQKSILILTVLVAIFSCKKEEKKALTVTDVTGTTVVKGNITKEVVMTHTNGGWNNAARIVAQGVNVNIKINKSSLYPHSTAEGADVYAGTTDANGNYSIPVKSNANGVEAQITIDGFTGTKDTLVNGSVKTGLYSTYEGTSFTTTLFMGQNAQHDYNFKTTQVVTNTTPLNVGTAIVTGSVATTFIKEVKVGNIITNTTIFVPKTSHPVFLSISKDPSTLSSRIYNVLTDQNGYYTFTVSTVQQGTQGFTQSASVWVEDLAATQDTIKPDNTVKKGRTGVFSKVLVTQGNVYNNAIRNATHLNYNNFIPD